MKAKGQKAENKEKTAEKKAAALKLRKDGYSYDEIGKMLGMSAMWAWKLATRAIREIYKDKAEDLVRMELQRLDDMQLEVLAVLRADHVVINSGCVVQVNVRDENGMLVMDQVTGLPKAEPIKDDGPRLAAIDRLLKIQERRSKLLGLDKPTKVAPTNPNGDKPAQPFVMMVSKEDAAL